jgi:ferric-dicitrate binding protein FerR (iron transport regulator)
MTKESLLEKIGQQSLTDAERQQAEAWCREDTAYAEAWQYEHILLAAIHIKERNGLKDKLQALEAAAPQKNGSYPPFIYKAAGGCCCSFLIRPVVGNPQYNAPEPAIV